MDGVRQQKMRKTVHIRYGLIWAGSTEREIGLHLFLYEFW
jgi:hypothetical protein